MPKAKAERHNRQTVRVNLYAIVARAVEEGVAFGVQRADNHAEDQTTGQQRERLYEHVASEVMLALSEVIEWGD